MSLPARLLRVLLAAALAAAAVPAAAADDAFEFYREEAAVVTASRRAEPAWKAPVAVDVITAEDLKAYGVREIWDALRYRAGLDVVEGRSLDGNRALVSARGFDSEFVAEMQVLVDGRSVYSPLLGGVYWQSLPVQIQDIERIEIVRGPNAALYGSNAVFGVINIITRKPGEGTRAKVSASAGGRSIAKGAAAVEAGTPGAGVSFSVTSRADDGHPSSTGAGDADDFLRLTKANARGRWTPAEKTELELLAGAAWMTAGLPGLMPDAQARHTQDFQTVRATRDLDGGSAVEASLSRSETFLRSEPVFAGDVRIRTYQYDAGLLHRFSWLDEAAKSSWGADWRESGADSVQVFGADPRHSNRVVRGFTHHSYEFTDALTGFAGASGEHSSTGGWEYAWQAALVATPFENHSFRATRAFAPTIPPLTEKFGDYRLSPGVTYVGSPSFGPERVTSWEFGWSGRLLEGRLRPSAAVYYMTIRRYSSTSSLPGGRLTTSNADRAIARGAELSGDLSLGGGRAVFANYTFESITNGKGASATGFEPSRTTPVHKFNLGARAVLPRGFSVSAVLGYKDAYLANSASRGLTAPVPRHFRLDARAAWAPRPGWELFVAGQELLQDRFTEYVDRTATPRTVRAGVEARFGP
ncbi:MAG: TonB-dependent receptor [Elusimicrobia bacterium]|nr:TonB-dependent receptor [Elusimicrobiota bacterium]